MKLKEGKERAQPATQGRDFRHRPLNKGDIRSTAFLGMVQGHLIPRVPKGKKDILKNSEIPDEYFQALATGLCSDIESTRGYSMYIIRSATEKRGVEILRRAMEALERIIDSPNRNAGLAGADLLSRQEFANAEGTGGLWKSMHKCMKKRGNRSHGGADGPGIKTG
jgi:hypothetical protein